MEISSLVSILSVFVACYSVFLTTKKDYKKDVSEIAVIVEKLNNISIGITELKEEMNGVIFEQSNLKVRIAGMESSLKQAHKRIDELKRAG